MGRDEIKAEFIKLNEDGLYDLHGEKKRAIAGFIELAKNDRDSALELFRELMQEGNFAAVELVGVISRDQNIGTSFKSNMREVLKLMADKLEDRVKKLGAKKLQTVAGSSDDSSLGMSLDTVLTTAAILELPLITEIIQVPEGQRVLVIDSDVNRGYQYQNDVDVVYQDVQTGTASCGDNAFCTATKAKALGLQTFLFLQNNHLVAMIYYPVNEDPSAIVALLETTEIPRNEGLWDFYKAMMVGSTIDESSVAQKDQSFVSTILLDLLKLFSMQITGDSASYPWWSQPDPYNDPIESGNYNKENDGLSFLVGDNHTVGENITKIYE